MRDVCAANLRHQPALEHLWKQSQRTNSGNKRSTRIKEGLVWSPTLPWRAPCSQEAGSLSRHTHSHIHTISCMLIKCFPTCTSYLRAKNKPDVMSPTPMMAFLLLGIIRIQSLNNGRQFPPGVPNNGVYLSLSFNGCTLCFVLIIGTGSSLWRKQEVDTWWLSLLF